MRKTLRKNKRKYLPIFVRVLALYRNCYSSNIQDYGPKMWKILCELAMAYKTCQFYAFFRSKMQFYVEIVCAENK